MPKIKSDGFKKICIFFFILVMFSCFVAFALSTRHAKGAEVTGMDALMTELVEYQHVITGPEMLDAAVSAAKKYPKLAPDILYAALVLRQQWHATPIYNQKRDGKMIVDRDKKVIPDQIYCSEVGDLVRGLITVSPELGERIMDIALRLRPDCLRDFKAVLVSIPATDDDTGPGLLLPPTEPLFPPVVFSPVTPCQDGR